MRIKNTEFVFFEYETANWTKSQPFTPWVYIYTIFALKNPLRYDVVVTG